MNCIWSCCWLHYSYLWEKNVIELINFGSREKRTIYLFISNTYEEDDFDFECDAFIYEHNGWYWRFHSKFSEKLTAKCFNNQSFSCQKSNNKKEWMKWNNCYSKSLNDHKQPELRKKKLLKFGFKRKKLEFNSQNHHEIIERITLFLGMNELFLFSFCWVIRTNELDLFCVCMRVPWFKLSYFYIGKWINKSQTGKWAL